MASFEIAQNAPEGADLTGYDRRHFLTYARLIDAEREQMDWRAAASVILLCDTNRDPEGAWLCWQSHLARAHWVLGDR